MSQLTTISGYVPTRPADELEEDRYDFLTLDQAEPNPGNPEEDGSLFISDADGTRSFTTAPTLTGLNFQANTLSDLSFRSSQYYLVLSGDPTDGIVDSVGWSTLVEIDTLQSVTDRGNVTDQNITVADLISQKLTADSANFSGPVTISESLSVSTDAGIGGNLIVSGNTDISLNLSVTGITTLSDSAVIQNKFFLETIDEKVDENKILYRRQSDGLILQGDLDAENIDKVNIGETDSNATHYPLFSYANNATVGFDSVYADFSAYTYQPFTNTLSVQNLDVSNIDATGITNLDSTFISGDVRIQTSVGRLLDSAGRSFVVYDSEGALLWGNNGIPAGDATTGEVQPVPINLTDLLDVDAQNPNANDVIAYNAITQKWEPVPNSGGGGGISLTDLSALTLTPAGTGDLSYDNGTGVFSYTPPVLPSSLLDLGILDGLNQQILSTDGNGNFTFIDNVSGSATGNVRVTQSVPTLTLGVNSTTNIEFNQIGKSFILHSVTVDSASWVRIYSDTSSRAADVGRTQGQEPIEGSGVIAEFIASSPTTFKVTPGVNGYADTENEIPVAITNLAAYETPFNISMDVLKLENNNPLIPTYSISGPATIDEDG
jgi:hypothetical protein